MAFFDGVTGGASPNSGGASSFSVSRLENDERSVVAKLGRFSVLEYIRDRSVAPDNVVTEYFMSKMDVRRRQVIIDLDGSTPAVLQAGAMQWTAGNIECQTGIKGAGDFFGKALRGAVTNESAIKPEYAGVGKVVLEPTYKYIILQEVNSWPGGMVIEDGMFLACDGSVQHSVVARSNFSSALAGGEGLFNLSLSGSGVVALESNVPMSELIEIELNNDTLKIDGNMAVMWSAGLQFTVERSSKSLLGSAINQEGLVNVFRGTGKVLMSPVAPTSSLFASTHDE
ncbi:MAG: AIM24 family protein [Atopobium sp.]|uniref:AIM24 family protein n=1 Tax=Atopobium sp. TaxID=1872650 RepID=UPI002A748C7F|nr:AIM24 family protein [Atopobium sp.]MDY2789000.1 AIM24 family protein [Atopobium sp.]MDY4522030.1 AIM24 family protein [Atopobium sp.]